ncbi:fungal specific transcription factor domain-containing protein [Aspergillus puulaauensis]|uniref:Transcription factor domain-containing protein n=1 Tax=Aspergillus puulaauensis TaxID=1220207 RepID=A0A7R7XXV3_9EURO|nr:uncharacterized protein APUU_80003S [Aspergillus puulaauensis]BCS29700.1 hypothetical protein APUU_80003S [Aspergillus puulaauensis]
MDIGAFGDYDWFFSFLRYSRLISKIQNQLLTIASVPKPVAVCHSMVDSLQSELESWRESIPLRFRPGEPLRSRVLAEDRAISMALRTHYYYHYAYLTLTWTLLHCNDDGTDPARQLGIKTELMQTARSVLELTSYIEISPSTPLWILALVPLCALMILFDLVIDNPNHSETSLNLALLDIASGHFSRIEYSSNGALPGGLISEFAHLARQYVSDIRHHSGKEHLGASFFSRTQGPQPQSFFCESAGNGMQELPMLPGREETNVCSKSASYPPATSLAPVHQPVVVGSGISSSLSDMTPVTTSQDQPFFPSVDGDMQHLQFIGVDLMGLFDPTYPFIGFDHPIDDPSGPV